MPIQFVEKFLEWLFQLHESSSLPSFAASLLALAVQIPFATFYLLDFLWTWILVAYYQGVLVLKASSSSALENPSLNVCRFLPLTTIPRTRAFQSLSLQDLVEEWRNLVTKSISSTTSEGKDLDDDALLSLLQTNQRARQLASYIIDKAVFPNSSSTNPEGCVDVVTTTKSIQSLLQQLSRIWFRALELPPRASSSTESSSTLPVQLFDISLIVPVYKERWEKIQSLLSLACEYAVHPNQIQVILVDAGGNQGLAITPNHTNDDLISIHPEENKHDRLKELLFESPDGSKNASSGDNRSWGHVAIVSYTGSGGRGGCMNHGAKQARGSILTFLHADTHLPPQWDRLVRASLKDSFGTPGENDNLLANKRTNLMAFSMGIQMPPNAPPAGLWGAGNFLGYIRCSVARLPYGDSTLSIPTDVFDYIGGYSEEQALMEDFEVVRLLRKRWLWFSLARRMFWLGWPHDIRSVSSERMVVVKEQIACSPRRWEQYGVPYVTLCNAYCIFLYSQRNTTADDLFDFYYRIRKSSTNKAKTS